MVTFVIIIIIIVKKGTAKKIATQELRNIYVCVWHNFSRSLIKCKDICYPELTGAHEVTNIKEMKESNLRDKFANVSCPTVHVYTPHL